MSFSHNPEPTKLPLSLVEAEVEAVSDDGYTVTVRTRDGKRLRAQVVQPALAIGRDTDIFGGAGFSHAPEEGSMALVETTSFGEYYVRGFVHPLATNGYQGRRESIKPGDMVLRSRRGAFVDVLASGLLRAGTGSQAQTVHNPIDGSIRSIAQNFAVSTAIGNLLWLLDAATGRGAFRVLSRTSVDSGSPAASLSLGDNPSGNLVELRTSSGKDSGFAIDRAGNVRVDSSKDITAFASNDGVVRIQGKKIYLNSGAAKGLQSFNNNFYETPTTAVTPGDPVALAKFPAMSEFPVSLPSPATKRALNPPQLTQPHTPLTPVAEPTQGSVLSGSPLPKL